jgi:hypothetical protein
VPVAWTNATHSGVITETHRQYLAEHYPNSPNDKIIPLYTSPQHSNALEMAHSECSACGSLTANSNEAEINNINKQLSSENERLRNLIPQPESDGK